MCWQCAGSVLVVCWKVLVVGWHCASSLLAVCWQCAGSVLVVCWQCAGSVLAVCWQCAGSVLAASSLPGSAIAGRAACTNLLQTCHEREDCGANQAIPFINLAHIFAA